MKVRVYYNLHRHLWSIVAEEGDQKGRVVAHAARVVLEEARMLVRPAGRRRVLEEKRKNVHAFVAGQWRPDDQGPAEGRPFSYNPYAAAHFTLRDDPAHPPVRAAQRVVLDGRRAVALDPRP